VTVVRTPPPDGFADFVTARSPALLRAAWLLTGDAGKAEDLLQTALARAWPHWRRVSAKGDPEAYVRRILFTTYVTWWRRRWRIETPVDQLPDHAAATDEAEAVVHRDTVRAALARLTRGQRAVLVLRFVEDRSEADAADLLGCSVGTVKSQTSKALARLRADDVFRTAITEKVAR
jgi:RNA polymerase sigma-70 factor (sigma-E family)